MRINNMCNKNNTIVQNGDIWMAALPKAEGHIQYGTRPIYIWSGEGNNKFAPTVNYYPLTSKLKKVYPMHVLIPTEYGLKVPSYTLPEQSGTLMKDRLLFKIGHCDELMMRKVEDGVSIHKGMKAIYTNDFNVKLQFNLSRVLSMADNIKKMQYLIDKQTNVKTINILEMDLNNQISFLRAYCNDFHKNINSYITLNDKEQSLLFKKCN